MRILKWLGSTVAVLVLAGVVAVNLSPIGRIYLPTATGVVAKQVCSLHFISGIAPQLARDLYLDPVIGDPARWISARVDVSGRSVHSRLLGLWHQEAVYREGLGCTLVHGALDYDRELRVPWTEAPTFLELDSAHRDVHFDGEAVEAAIDGAFDEGFGPRNTLAVVVLHEGRLIGERYAPGFTRENRLHGWSMAKSVATTLAGAMTQQGLVDVHAEGEIELLDGLGAEGEATTVDDLLRMTGGRAAHEYNTGTDPNTDMLFTETDMAAFTATRARLHPPGAHWEYMSGDTVLATWELQSRLGASLADQVRAMRALIFEPAGIHSPVFEVDASGTLQGSSYVYATPQDWARLMQVYLDDGVAAGRRMLPQGWADYVTEPTPGSGDPFPYGAGFWLAGEYLTPDAFFMSGFQGQDAFAIPEHGLVIVRMGATNWRDTGAFQMARAIMAAQLPVSSGP